jgi:hypothetical protein
MFGGAAASGSTAAKPSKNSTRRFKEATSLSVMLDGRLRPYTNSFVVGVGKVTGSGIFLSG